MSRSRLVAGAEFIGRFDDIRKAARAFESDAPWSESRRS
jgi:hypothetical protein